MTDFDRRRARMVADQLGEIADPRVRAAMARVPRHEFVPAGLARAAYDDRPLPVGHGQTISQPLIVAMMTEALDLSPGDRILEVGTGTGYQTAVLSEMGARICTIERIADLADSARERLAGRDVHFHVGDGSVGVPEEAPFDAILVAAGAPSIPLSLVDQLRAEGGRMVIPVGPVGAQDLLLIRRDGVTAWTRSLCACTFVRLVGREGWSLAAN